jgi:hypothetical protein
MCVDGWHDWGRITHSAKITAKLTLP